MYHAISSDDDDLPAVASLLSSRVQPPHGEPIVLSDSDSEYTLDLGARLSKRNTANQEKTTHTTALKNISSSDSDFDPVVKAVRRPLPAGLGDESMPGDSTAGFASSAGLAMSAGNDVPSPTTKRKKRTPEEIAESKRHAVVTKVQKDEEKERKRLEREEKAKYKEAEMAKKRFLRETKRAATPAECLKHLTVMVDPELVKRTCGARIIAMAAERELRYEVQSQPHANLISFWREVSEVSSAPNQQFEVVKREVVEDQLLLWLPMLEFVEYVYWQRQQQKGMSVEHYPSLRSFIHGLQRKLENRSITLIVQGLQQYYKVVRKIQNDINSGGSTLASTILAPPPTRQVKGQQRVPKRRGEPCWNDRPWKRVHKRETNNIKIDGVPLLDRTLDREQARSRGNRQQQARVSRLDVEETLVDIQFTTCCNIRFTETDEETAKLVWHYTKAVAETPYKMDRNSSAMNIHIDTTTCVKLEADGSGVTRAWRQIIQIFRGISAEVANAIMAEYPTPRALYQAYQKCSTEKEAVKLLENIMVRRGYGVMETSRRVGKELGKKLYTLFTTNNPSETIK